MLHLQCWRNQWALFNLYAPSNIPLRKKACLSLNVRWKEVHDNCCCACSKNCREQLKRCSFCHPSVGSKQIYLHLRFTFVQNFHSTENRLVISDFGHHSHLRNLHANGYKSQFWHYSVSSTTTHKLQRMNKTVMKTSNGVI